MNKKQLVFVIVCMSIICTVPLILTDGIIRLSILLSYGLTVLIILGIIGAVKLYIWLGDF
jgi:hypothetical protein